MATLRLWTFGTALFAGGLLTGVAGGFVFIQLPPTEAGDAVPRHWEATIFLPRVDNDNRPFPPDLWQQALALFVAEFDGVTLPAEVEGCWRNGDGQLRRERVQPIIVSYKRGRSDDLRRVMHEVGLLLGQEAVYARVEEPRVLLLPIDAKSSRKDR